MRAFTRVREAFNRWLRKLAESNREQFGSDRPDCCQMNRLLPKTKGGTHR
jgi:hypothetical protein